MPSFRHGPCARELLLFHLSLPWFSHQRPQNHGGHTWISFYRRTQIAPSSNWLGNAHATGVGPGSPLQPHQISWQLLRRRAKGASIADPQRQHLAAEIQVLGPMGYNPRNVIIDLMHVVSRQTGIDVTDASLLEDLPAASWRWLAATDPSAPPGRVRLQLESFSQVQAVVNAVHQRTIQFGTDWVSIEVQNDLLDATFNISGNGDRGSATTRP